MSNINKQFSFTVGNTVFTGVKQKAVYYTGCAACVASGRLCSHVIEPNTYLMEYCGDAELESCGTAPCRSQFAASNGHEYDFCHKISSRKAVVINPISSFQCGAVHPFINHGPDFRSHPNVRSVANQWLTSRVLSVDEVEANCAARPIRLPPHRSTQSSGTIIIIILHSIKAIEPNTQLFYDHWLGLR